MTSFRRTNVFTATIPSTPRGVAVGIVVLALTASPQTASAQCKPHWSDRFAATEWLFSNGVGSLASDPSALGGPVLYAAGGESGTARGVAQLQNGEWSTIGDMNDDVLALALFDDDGAGPHPTALYAAGRFLQVGGQTVNRIAKWDGVSWSPVGSGVGFSDYVLDLESIDLDGAGPNPAALYAAGRFTSVDGVAANAIAKWNGSSWSPLGAGVGNALAFGFSVYDVVAFDDDGPGPHGTAVYVAGDFETAGGAPANDVATWNGTVWSPLGNGLDGVNSVSTGIVLAVHDDDGPGPTLPALYLGGEFKQVDGLPAMHVARWNGASWSALGSELAGYMDWLYTLASFDVDGAGPMLPRLIAGGGFHFGSNPVRGPYLAQWNGIAWSSVGSGTSGAVGAVHAFDADGAGSEPESLYIGGNFDHVAFSSGSPIEAPKIARWDGSAWHRLGRGVDGTITAFATFDDDSDGARAPALYAGGDFLIAGAADARRVARYDGDSWSALGSGLNARVNALAVFDEDGAGPGRASLFAGGEFTTAGGIAASRIARWDGVDWSPVGGGMNDVVLALYVYDADGPGPAPTALYAGGKFTTAGGVSAARVARWDGSAWSPLGAGLNGAALALSAFDRDGAGSQPPLLVAGGQFSSAGGSPASFVASWNGASWSALASGMDSVVSALVAYDEDGGGPELTSLVAGGPFTTAGGNPASGVARWNGSAWSAVGAGVHDGFVDTSVESLRVFDEDGAGPGLPSLFAGGRFETAGTIDAHCIAKWDGIRWSALDSGLEGTLFDSVEALGVFDDGTSAPTLHVGGNFRYAGGNSSLCIAAWICCGSTFESFCFGDGSLTTACPCTPPNTVPNPPAAIGHGCANSLNLDGARMFASGTTTPDTVQFEVDVAPLYAGFGFISKGNAFLANGEAASDGIRCTSGQLLRFGGHNAGTNGAPIGTWTYPNSVQTLSVSAASAQPLGQTAYYQLFYRNAAANFCNAATANFSSGVKISWQ